jgi:hypothetical protein
MDFLRKLVWPAVLAVLLCAISVVAGLLQAPINIWLPIGLAGIASAMLAGRADK